MTTRGKGTCVLLAGAALSAALIFNSVQLAPLLYLDNSDNDLSSSGVGADDKTAQTPAAKKIFALLLLSPALSFLSFLLWKTEQRRRLAPGRSFAVANHRARPPPLTPA